MDASTLTPYILAALSVQTGVLAWLVKRSIAQGENYIALRTAFRFYLVQTGKGAAEVLDSPNPTPPDMRLLLRKYVNGSLSEPEERRKLKTWLYEVKDSNAPKSERSAAIQLLAAMEASRLLR